MTFGPAAKEKILSYRLFGQKCKSNIDAAILLRAMRHGMMVQHVMVR